MTNAKSVLTILVCKALNNVEIIDWAKEHCLLTTSTSKSKKTKSGSRFYRELGGSSLWDCSTCWFAQELGVLTGRARLGHSTHLTLVGTSTGLRPG